MLDYWYDRVRGMHGWVTVRTVWEKQPDGNWKRLRFEALLTGMWAKIGS